MATHDDLHAYIARVTDEEVEAWMADEGLKAPSAVEDEGFDTALETMGEPFGPSPYLSTATAIRLAEYGQRSDAREVAKQINGFIDAGLADLELRSRWRHHLEGEQTNQIYPFPDTARPYAWAEGTPPRLRQALDRIKIETVSSLGPAIGAVAFVGPRTTRIVLGRDDCYDDQEAEFRIWRLCFHTLASMPVDGFGIWIDYKRDLQIPAIDPILKEELRLQQNVKANDYAASRMYGLYQSSGFHTTQRGIMRELLGGNWLAPVGNLYDKASAHYASLVRAIRPHPHFTESLALVRRAWWAPTYLVWTDTNGDLRRRWVPSRSVIYALGVRLDDIEPMKVADINRYRYEGLLIEPDDIAVVRGALLAQQRLLNRKGDSVTELPLGTDRSRRFLDLTAVQGRR